MAKVNPWFRVYNEIIDDEKLLMLGFSDRWFFVALLALKRDLPIQLLAVRFTV